MTPLHLPWGEEHVKRFPVLPIPDDALRSIAARATLERIDEENGWAAFVPEFKGAWATGPTENSARDELVSVLREWISLGVYHGDQLPEAAYRVLAITPH